ncbi:MAG TPA: hypothetical protein PLL98_08850 [Bacillota bacterium]|nr:hypothetical protein [Bacillota bacterium]
MTRIKKTRALITAGFTAFFILAMISSVTIGVRADPFLEVKAKLNGISEEEREILQGLFTLAQEIELLEAEEKELAQEIESTKKEIEKLEAAIAERERAYEKKKESLKGVLQSYQRMGPGSFLEIILDSDNLGEFLDRVNILRDLTHNTGELLNQLEESGKALINEKTMLSGKLFLVEEKQKQSRETLVKRNKLKTEKEEYLASLKGEKEYYKGYLAAIEGVWNELKPLVSDVAKGFNHIMEDVSLPADALKITISFPEIKASIEDTIINKIISEQPDFPDMVLAFHPGKAEIALPDKNLALSGTFTIIEGHILKFQAQEGSFFGMALEPGSIEELIGEGGLALNLKPLLAGNTIQDLNIKEGYLELISKLKLF